MVSAASKQQSEVRDLYAEVETNSVSLVSSLPSGAVRGLATEALSRIARAGGGDDAHQSKPPKETITSLTTALVSGGQLVALRMIEDLRANGVCVEDIHLQYLAASARQLGEWWTEGRASFTDVTIGTGRIMAIIRSLAHAAKDTSLTGDRQAVFAAVPGEEHTLGLSVATALFRQMGWDIIRVVGATHDEVIDTYLQSRFRTICLSASGKHAEAGMIKLVIALRAEKPRSKLYLCGQIVRTCRKTLAAVSPDGMASEYDEAKKLLMAHA